MTPLRKRFQKHLTFKRFAPKTHEAYIGAVKGLANHYHKSPDQLSDEQIQDYFVYLLKERKYAWSSCNVIFCGVKLFYEEILDRDTMTVIPPRPRQKQLPTILSQAEVSKLINACVNLGLVLTSATVATKNVGRAISRCLFNELIATFFGDLHFRRNNDQARKSEASHTPSLCLQWRFKSK